MKEGESMGYIINDKDFINDNIFKFEKRLESQYTIFLDKNPTFVTYYHINNANSIADSGLLNVEEILGPQSPIEFQKINDFPIYGIDQIQIDLAEEDEGLNGSYSGEGIILPNTIKPLPNDYFLISYLDQSYAFMITNIAYDTIKSNNFYRIEFYLKSISDAVKDLLENQTLEKYNCIFKNIGTDDKCLIEEDICELILRVNKAYKNIVERYITLFYSKKFNSLLFNDFSHFNYDKYLTHFVNKYGLLNEKDDYNTIVLSNQDDGLFFLNEYDESFYTVLEDCDLSSVRCCKYTHRPITYDQSIFLLYNLDNVRSVLFIDIGQNDYIEPSTIEKILTNSKDWSDVIEEALVKYFNKSLNIRQFSIDALERYKITYSMRDFTMIPMLMFIIRKMVAQNLRV